MKKKKHTYYYKFEYDYEDDHTGERYPPTYHKIKYPHMYKYVDGEWKKDYTFRNGSKLANDYYERISKENLFLELI